MEPTPDAYVDELGGDTVVVRVHYWVDDPLARDLFAARSAYTRAAKVRLDAAGVTISPASKRELLARVMVAEGDEGAAA